MLHARRPKWFYLISLSVLFSIGLYVYYYPNPSGDSAFTFHPLLTQADEILEDVTKSGYFVYSATCKISQLPVRDPPLEKYFTPEAFESCVHWNEGKPRLVGSNRTHVFVLRSALKYYALNATRGVKCYYRPFTSKYILRNKYGTIRARYGRKVPLSLPVAITDDEFIRVECVLNKTKIYTDFFSFVPEPRGKSKKLSLDYREVTQFTSPEEEEFSAGNSSEVSIDFATAEAPNTESSESEFLKEQEREFSKADSSELSNEEFSNLKFSRHKRSQFSVLILGIDAVSRLNFLRQMTSTYSYLESGYDVVDMRGYNKIGDNTFPNVVATLTGLSESELENTCWPTPESTFDACPFLWTNFSARGYKTLLVEDSFPMSTFNYVKSGFRNPPTDYFYNVFSKESEGSIGNSRLLNANLCIGSQLIFKTILEYTLKFTIVLKDYLFFAFVWTSSLTHDFLNLPRLGDPILQSFVKNLNKSGSTNSTILVLTSDHGLRWGDFRETYQGHMEERLPFLFFVLPAKFRENHRRAYKNLLYNQHRLTTPYDLHETLKNLLDLSSISDDVLRRSFNSSQRGISLFRRVPVNRTCPQAAIPPHYCTCHDKIVHTSLKSSIVLGLSRRLLSHINEILLKPVASQCHLLKLDQVLSAQYEQTISSLQGNWTQRDYTISVRTVPGLAIFESTMRYNRESGKTDIVGDVSRLNVYANQSACVNEARLKLYCYCR